MKSRTGSSDEGLTVYNFEYAVRLDALLVGLFRHNGGEWQFVRNIKRWNGITVCQLSECIGDRDLLAFPVGMMPDQVWNLLNRLEEKHLTGLCLKSKPSKKDS